MKSRDEFMKELKTRIEEWNNEISQVEQNLKNASEHARIETEEKLNELRRYRDDARARLAEVEQQSEDAWQAARDRTEAAWNKLNDGFRRILDRARGGPRE